MASEDIFKEYTEEIVAETPQEANDNDAAGLEEETEDFTALLNNEEIELEEEIVSTEQENNNDTEETTATEQASVPDTNTENAKTKEAKLIQLPLARIRNIMKLDPDLNIASNEALFAVARSTELFIESLAREAYVHTQQAKKKTIQKRDVDMAISAVDSLMFLEGAMNF